MDNNSQISIDPGVGHKVDGFATSPDASAVDRLTGAQSPKQDDENKPKDNAEVQEEKAEWEGEGGSPPDAISSIDEDGDPPDRPDEGRA